MGELRSSKGRSPARTYRKRFVSVASHNYFISVSLSPTLTVFALLFFFFLLADWSMDVPCLVGPGKRLKLPLMGKAPKACPSYGEILRAQLRGKSFGSTSVPEKKEAELQGSLVGVTTTVSTDPLVEGANDGQSTPSSSSAQCPFLRSRRFLIPAMIVLLVASAWPLLCGFLGVDVFKRIPHRSKKPRKSPEMN